MNYSFLVLFPALFKICLRVLCHICAMTSSQKHKLRQTFWTWVFYCRGKKEYNPVSTVTETALKRKNWKSREIRTNKKLLSESTVNVTSSHDWCDCIYSISVGCSHSFPTAPSSPHPHYHYVMVSMVTAQQVSKSLREMASMTHCLWRCWRRCCLYWLSTTISMNNVKVERKESSAQIWMIFQCLSME